MPPKRKASTSKIEDALPEKRTRRQVGTATTMNAESYKTSLEIKNDTRTRKVKGKVLDSAKSVAGLERTDTFKDDVTEAICSCEEDARLELKPKPKRKTKEVDLSDCLPRRIESPWKVGAHVSAAGGVENAVLNALDIGATSFALFLKSQRKWESPPLTDESIKQFKKNMEQHGYSSTQVLPHGSYLINLANPDKAKRQKSYDCFLDDLKRCELLGLGLYNFHPGSTLGEPLEAAIKRIADCINDAHAATSTVTIVLENMAGAGNIIGSDFAHLASIIKLVDNKNRIGVCIDTCHAFAAGYDIRTQEGWDDTMKQLEDVVGLKYLRGMHINDSKTELSSKRDRHESIGIGHIGLQAFRHILNDPRTQNIPLVLETPSFEQPRDVWGKEIEVLQRISGLTSSPSKMVKEETSEDDSTMSLYVEEIRQAVKKAEKNEKKPGGVKVKKAGGRKKVDEPGEEVEDEDDDALPETQKTDGGNSSSRRSGRISTTSKPAPRKTKSKKVAESDDES